jgi:uncharacterized membrane protein YjjP (DUF1212 family)
MGGHDDDQARPEEEHDGLPAVPMVGTVVKKTTRFSKEVVATMISLASAAFGVVAALAWNSAITTWFTHQFGVAAKATKVSALFIYAVVVTLIGVVVIVMLGRLAARINAEPVEFKYPVVPKS